MPWPEGDISPQLDEIARLGEPELSASMDDWLRRHGIHIPEPGERTPEVNALVSQLRSIGQPRQRRFRLLAIVTGLLAGLLVTRCGYEPAYAHRRGQGADQFAQEGLPLIGRQAPAQGRQFALEPDPFQVDDAAATQRAEAIDAGEGGLQGVGQFHGSRLLADHLSTLHNSHETR